MLLRPSDDELQTPERINRENEDFKYAGAILHLDPSNEVEDSWSRDTEYKPKLTTLDGTYRQLIASNLAHGWPSSGMYLRKLIYKGSGIFSSPGLITRYTGSVGASLAVWAISGLLALMGARACRGHSFEWWVPSISPSTHCILTQYAYGSLVSYLFSFTAITALKSSTGAIIATILAEYIMRVFSNFGRKSQDQFQDWNAQELPQLYVKTIACIAIFLVFLAQAFHPVMGPGIQKTVTGIKVALACCIPIIALILALGGRIPDASKHAFSSFANLFEGSTSNISQYALALYSGLWAFDGWDQCTFVTGEMRDAPRKISQAILLSTETVTALFLSIVTSYFLVLAPDTVARTNSAALDFGVAAFGSIGGIMFASLVAFSCVGALNGHMYTYTRLAAAAGQNGFLPECFGNEHHRFRTPFNAQVFTCIFTILFVVFGSGFASLISFAGVCSWFWYGCTVTCVLVLRAQEPYLERPYRVWITTPIFFLLVALFLLVMPIFSAPWEALAAFLFIAMGIPLYFITQLQARYNVWTHLFSSRTEPAFQRMPNNIPLSEMSSERPM